MKAPRGFTLIELLLVATIIAILTSIMTVFLDRARKLGGDLATRSIMNRIDAALGAFKLDSGTYPYQDHTGQPDDQPSINILARRLSRNLNASERTALHIDLAMIDVAYTSAPNQVGSADVPAAETTAEVRPLHAGLVNRLATERGRLAVLAGNQRLTAIAPRLMTDLVYTSLTSPGWCADYLEGSLSPRERDGDTILDGFGRSIIYHSPIVTGVTGASPPGPVSGDANSSASIPLDPLWWRLNTRSTRSATSTSADLRLSASPQLLLTYELRSAGADGRFSFLRHDPANRDNIAFRDYDRGLP